MIKTAAVTSSMCFSTSNLMSFKAGAIHSGICDTCGMTSSKTHASESWTCYCMFRGYLEGTCRAWVTAAAIIAAGYELLIRYILCGIWMVP